MSTAKHSRYPPRINLKSAAKPSVNWLPEELILEVFLRLSRKSLLRFRRVSKTLRNSIDNSLFRKRYDTFHNSVSDFAVMHMEAGRLFSRDFHLTDNLHPYAEKEVSIPHNRDPRFIGSCKGIVCLMDSASLKSCVLLNPFNITYQKVKCRNTCHIWNSFGFGYDCATDDYKIVVWKTYKHSSIHQYLDVYSMRRDSWRHVIREFSPSCSPQVNGICVEGAIHWKGINENRNGCSCIVAFDLETEVLRSFPLPHHLIVIAIGQPWSLHDLGGRLCVIVKSLFGSIIVSVMEEYGVETSWTQLFDFGSAFILWHFPTWDNLVLLWLESDLRTLSWFNTKRGSMEDIHIHKVPHRQGNNQTWNETQSWVCVRSPLRLRCS